MWVTRSPPLHPTPLSFRSTIRIFTFYVSDFQDFQLIFLRSIFVILWPPNYWFLIRTRTVSCLLQTRVMKLSVFLFTLRMFWEKDKIVITRLRMCKCLYINPCLYKSIVCLDIRYKNFYKKENWEQPSYRFHFERKRKEYHDPFSFCIMIADRLLISDQNIHNFLVIRVKSVKLIIFRYHREYITSKVRNCNYTSSYVYVSLYIYT